MGAQTAAPAPAAAPSSAPSRSSGPPPSYVGRLSAALERAKRYPQRARLRRSEGIAHLNFSMRRDGSVVNWRIVRSTGDADLDEAVGEMIERASPLPAPPPEMEGDPINLTVPINFNMR
jgi:protein TonB